MTDVPSFFLDSTKKRARLGPTLPRNLLQFAETCVKNFFLLFALDHGERLAVSSARSALDLPRPRLLRAHVLWRLSPPSFPLTPAA